MVSADNWAVCPKCKELAIKAREEKMLAAGKAYGSVPPTEYLEMLKAVDTPLVHPETFREDYELGVMADGSFYVSYSGSCKECGLSHKFKHEEQLAL